MIGWGLQHTSSGPWQRRDAQRRPGRKRERRYFISSLDGTSAQVLVRAVRGHWGIENKLHWVLDACFGEDAWRVRKGHGTENLSRLRRMAPNPLRREKTERLAIKNNRLLAGWNHDSLLKLLTG